MAVGQRKGKGGSGGSVGWSMDLPVLVSSLLCHQLVFPQRMVDAVLLPVESSHNNYIVITEHGFCEGGQCPLWIPVYRVE